MILGYFIGAQLFFDQTFGQERSSSIILIVAFSFYLFILIFIRSITLTTKIDQKGIDVRYFPLLRKKFTWDKIDNIKVLQYKFVGYGIRFSSQYGTCYNTKGNKGIALQLKSGKKYLIGTQDSEKVKSIIQKYFHG